MSAPREWTIFDVLAEQVAQKRVEAARRTELEELGDRIDRLDDQGVDTSSLVEDYASLQRRLQEVVE